MCPLSSTGQMKDVRDTQAWIFDQLFCVLIFTLKEGGTANFPLEYKRFHNEYIFMFFGNTGSFF
jgi:hypothetical protein